MWPRLAEQQKKTPRQFRAPAFPRLQPWTLFNIAVCGPFAALKERQNFYSSRFCDSPITDIAQNLHTRIAMLFLQPCLISCIHVYYKTRFEFYCDPVIMNGDLSDHAADESVAVSIPKTYSCRDEQRAACQYSKEKQTAHRRFYPRKKPRNATQKKPSTTPFDVMLGCS